jgi:hypothetical protein
LNEVRMRSVFKAMLALAWLVAACADAPADAADGAQSKREKVAMDQGTNDSGGVSGLPSSFGRSFATLDEYLEHLRDYAGPVDLPWYREVRPGVYEEVTTITPAAAPKTYTREELMRKYGFIH